MAPIQDSIVEADIATLSDALNSGRITAVDLVVKYLQRIIHYDCRNTGLNSIPLLNPSVFDEAAESDARRRSGKPLGRLEGIPFTVKDSYKVQGLAVANGSEAFENLIANEDAFTVRALRAAGAIFIGKTNMCPMAFGGMLRGVYGRAESPYNSKYLAAAFGSGSSNGSGVSTAASFAAFGMGEETVSSGRSPASNNALVAYTPSRGLISIRGNWPLYPTCDTVVPHTRSMDDLFQVLDVITTEDENTIGDFWRDQPFVDIPKCWPDRPNDFSSIKTDNFLRGKRIAVPEMYLKSSPNLYISGAVTALWEEVRSELEANGVIIEIIPDFPVVQIYESKSPSSLPSNAQLPEDWNTTERGTLIAHAWDDYLRTNADSNLSTLSAAEWSRIFPQLPKTDPQAMFSEVSNAIHWPKLSSYVKDNTTPTTPGQSKMYDIPNLKTAVKALENMRHTLFDTWLTQHNYDFVAFPAAGDVGLSSSDVDVQAAEHTWKNGVKYSHGNRALRHLGIPSVTLPMGMLEGSDMPMGLTILGRAYDDVEILKAGYAFERMRQRRVSPALTPALETDGISGEVMDLRDAPPTIEVETCKAQLQDDGNLHVAIRAIITGFAKTAKQPEVWVQIDDKKFMYSLDDAVVDGKVTFDEEWPLASPPPKQDSRNEVVGKIARDSTIIQIFARNGASCPSNGWLKVIHNTDF